MYELYINLQLNINIDPHIKPSKSLHLFFTKLILYTKK